MPDGSKDEKCRGNARLLTGNSMTSHDQNYDSAKIPVGTVCNKVNLRVFADGDPEAATRTAGVCRSDHVLYAIALPKYSSTRCHES